MINREAYNQILESLLRQSAVGIIGPRQVGKTTLALEIGKNFDSIYLDLESKQDRAKLENLRLYLDHHKDKMVIFDEIHRMPEIFQELRGIIDARRRDGKNFGQFLILGSASIDLLRQSSETLAGRIEYINLLPFNVLELQNNSINSDIQKLWLRGGFPNSYLASNDRDSYIFRENFIQTYLERDIAQFGPRIPSETLERFWIMLAHHQASMFNASKLASNLSITSPTTVKYLDLLVDLLLVRRLSPYHSNLNKRQIKSPKTYIRDSGILHTLLGIETYDDLISNPVVGSSFEGFVIENIISILPHRAKTSFYRNSSGSEIDLILELPKNLGIWAIEIKLGTNPKLSKGFYNAIQELKPNKSFIVYSGNENYPIADGIEVIGLYKILKILKNI